MSRISVITALLTSQLLAACGPHETTATARLNPRLQLRITGMNVANMRSGIRFESRHQAWLWGAPNDRMDFFRMDTIHHLLALGKSDRSFRFDSTSIGRDEVITLTLKIGHRKQFKPAATNAKPVFLVELLADGQVVKAAQVPALVADGQQSTAGDSVATLTFDTSTL